MIKFKLSFWGAWLGNLFEHYDTALFGFLSPFLAPLLFPDQDPILALILTYAILPLGMIAKPIGALVFGHIGDHYGRKAALCVTLIGMGLVSGCMGFCPLYAEAGLFAPLFIYLGRFLQNFFASGELTGGALFLLEQTPKHKHDFVSGFYGASTVGGILCASAGITLLGYAGGVAEGWRGLYFLGSITAFLGLFLWKERPSCASSPGFSLTTLLCALKEEKKAFASIALIYGFSYATYTIALVLMNGFIPLISSITKEQMSAISTPLLVLDFALLPFFGWVATKISRETLMFGSALATVLFGIPLMLLMEGGHLFTVLFARSCFVLLGVSFCAPFYSWAQELISTKNRYLILSLSSALGSQLIGGPTAALSLWLFKTTHMVSSVAWYWVFLALASMVTLFLLKEKKSAAASI